MQRDIEFGGTFAGKFGGVFAVGLPAALREQNGIFNVGIGIGLDGFGADPGDVRVFQFTIGGFTLAHYFEAIFGVEERGFINFGDDRFAADGPFHIEAANAGKDLLPAVQWGDIDDAEVLHDLAEHFVAAVFETGRGEHVQHEFFFFILFDKVIGSFAREFG